MRELGQEFGTVTGRERRPGWLDLVALRYAVRLNGITSLALTKLDVLSTFDELQVCVRLPPPGRDARRRDFPAHQSDFHHAAPVMRDAAGLGRAARRLHHARRPARGRARLRRAGRARARRARRARRHRCGARAGARESLGGVLGSAAVPQRLGGWRAGSRRRRRCRRDRRRRHARSCPPSRAPPGTTAPARRRRRPARASPRSGRRRRATRRRDPPRVLPRARPAGLPLVQVDPGLVRAHATLMRRSAVRETDRAVEVDSAAREGAPGRLGWTRARARLEARPDAGAGGAARRARQPRDRPARRLPPGAGRGRRGPARPRAQPRRRPRRDRAGGAARRRRRRRAAPKRRRRVRARALGGADRGLEELREGRHGRGRRPDRRVAGGRPASLRRQGRRSRGREGRVRLRDDRSSSTRGFAPPRRFPGRS